MIKCALMKLTRMPTQSSSMSSVSEDGHCVCVCVLCCHSVITMRAFGFQKINKNVFKKNFVTSFDVMCVGSQTFVFEHRARGKHTNLHIY